MRSMHIHSDDTNQVHTISGNQCSAWIKQLSLSQTYSSSPCLHSVSVRPNDASQTHLVQHYPLIALYYRLSQRLDGIHSTSPFCDWSRSILPFSQYCWLVQSNNVAVLLIRRSRSSAQASMAFNLFSVACPKYCRFSKYVTNFPSWYK